MLVPRTHAESDRILKQSQSSSPTCFLGQGYPVAGIAEPLDEAPEDGVLLLRPRSPLHLRLVAARRPPHLSFPLSAVRSSVWLRILCNYVYNRGMIGSGRVGDDGMQREEKISTRGSNASSRQGAGVRTADRLFFRGRAL